MNASTAPRPSRPRSASVMQGGALLLILALTVTAVAAPADRGTLVRRELPGRLDDLAVVDVDGDGQDDLVCTTHQGASRLVAICRNQADFQPVLMGLPPDVTAAAVGDVLPAPGPELLLLSRNRVEARSLRDPAQPSRTVAEKLDLFFELPDREVRLAELVQDTDGDGRADLLLPTVTGYAYLPGTPEGLGAPVPLPGRPRQTVAPGGPGAELLSVTWELPRPALADLDGDHLQELLYLADQDLVTLSRGPDGQWKPARRREAGAAAGTFLAGRNDRVERRRSILVEVDGDGRLDLMATTNSGDISNLSSFGTRVEIYLARHPDFPAERPDAVLAVSGVSIPPRVLDYDGDGDGDLVVSSFRTDLTTGISAAMLKAIKVTYSVFLWDGGRGRLETRPVLSRDVDVPLGRLTEGGGSVPLAFLHGDFDGDGQKDLLELGDDELRITPVEVRRGLFGGSSLAFASAPRWRVATPVTWNLRIADLNRDGRDEVILLLKSEVVVWRPPAR